MISYFEVKDRNRGFYGFVISDGVLIEFGRVGDGRVCVSWYEVFLCEGFSFGALCS